MIAQQRVREAKTLLEVGHYPGAFYLVGYAVECALKSCVAKQVKRYDFPDKKLANAAYTHDLGTLLRVAGLARAFEHDRKANPALDLSWAVAKDWTEDARYEVGITERQARDLYAACVGRNGVLPWVKRRW
jgi:HEPN domain-containing protein